MPDVCSELGDVREVPGLPGRPLSRGPERATQGLVVRPNSEMTALQVMAVVLDGQEKGQKFLVERTVFPFRVGQLLGIETERLMIFSLGENGADCYVRGVCRQR